MPTRTWCALFGLIACVAGLLAGCSTPTPQVIEKIVTQVVRETQEVRVVETQIVERVVEKVKVVPAEPFTSPHPILGDLRVRQAIAHCIDRNALIAAVYPYVEDPKLLRMDSFLPREHWAYRGPYPDYPFDPDKGKTLLDDAGWRLPTGAAYRTDARGDVLALKLTTTLSDARQVWTALVERSLRECGIELVRQQVPPAWWFGEKTGLARRDFELAAYAWIGQAEPGALALFGCERIPSPDNNWRGNNYTGWCNPQAGQAMLRAGSSLQRVERIHEYDSVQRAFGDDLVSLPLFQWARYEVWSKDLEGVAPDATEFSTAELPKWKLAKGRDSLVIGFSEDPGSLYHPVELTASGRQLHQLVFGALETRRSYDFQPGWHEPLSTLENGQASNAAVPVSAGDTVWNSAGKPEKLAKGTRVLAGGTELEWDGSATLSLPRLVVTYRFREGMTWSDGMPVSAGDLKLGREHDCDPASEAIERSFCEAVAQAEFGPGLQAVITYWPGFQDPLYHLYPWSIYPEHQVLSDGRTLAQVPAGKWQGLAELTTRPMGYGPYVIREWKPDESLSLAANPHYKPAPAIKTIKILILDDADEALARLLKGEVDYLERASLDAAPVLEAALEAVQQGKINARLVPDPTWEHLDFNLFAR